jgi:hypothetical protein
MAIWRPSSLYLEGAYDFFEGITKAPAKGRTFIFREVETVCRLEEELKPGVFEMPQRSIH